MFNFIQISSQSSIFCIHIHIKKVTLMVHKTFKSSFRLLLFLHNTHGVILINAVKIAWQLNEELMTLMFEL